MRAEFQRTFGPFPQIYDVDANGQAIPQPRAMTASEEICLVLTERIFYPVAGPVAAFGALLFQGKPELE